MSYIYYLKGLLHNGGFCNGSIIKRILYLEAFETNIIQKNDVKKRNFITFNFYHRAVIKPKDHCITHI